MTIECVNNNCLIQWLGLFSVAITMYFTVSFGCLSFSFFCKFLAGPFMPFGFFFGFIGRYCRVFFYPA